MISALSQASSSIACIMRAVTRFEFQIFNFLNSISKLDESFLRSPINFFTAKA